MEKNELPLGFRLATRYVPNQILSSSFSWGTLFGADEVRHLGKYFREHSISQEEPTLTREWLIYSMIEVIEGRLANSAAAAAAAEEDDVTHCESLPDETQLRSMREEVTQWASSFAVPVAAHEFLWDLCESSNAELRGLLGDSKGKMRRTRLSPSRSFMRVIASHGPSNTATTTTSSMGGPSLGIMSEVAGSTNSSRPLKRECRSHAVVRWSDLTTNLVHDYEHYHRHDEKELAFTLVHESGAGGGGGGNQFIATTKQQKQKQRRQQQLESEAEALIASEQHIYSADCVLVAPASGIVATASHDGIVKLWDITNGNFQRNLYNAGNAWVIGMFLLHDEDYILIATTNSQLTVLEFPSGFVIQKYLGCYSILTAPHSVMQLSALNTQRYGMRPGACGAHRVPLHDGETAADYHRRRHDAQTDDTPRSIPVRPVVGFLSPTCSWFETYTGVFFFGTADGAVGAFDIAADVRPSALLAGANTRPLRLLFGNEVHAGAVVGIFYTSYTSSLVTAGVDGCLYRIPINPAMPGSIAGEPRPIAATGKSIRQLHWAPPSKCFITAHVDRRVLLWAFGRQNEPLHSFPSEAQEVVAVAMHPRRPLLAVLLADKMIKVYETHSNRSLATIAQPAPVSNFTATDVWRVMMERAVRDEGGAVTWHPQHTRLVCGLRAPLVYEPAHGTMHRSLRVSLAAGGNSLVPVSGAKRHSHDPSSLERGTSMGSGTNSSASCNVMPFGDTMSTSSGATHSGGVVSFALNRQQRELHTFDAGEWRTWSVVTGELLRHVDVPHAVRRAHLSTHRAAVVSCAWTAHTLRRLVTGGQDATLTTWDPATGEPLDVEPLAPDAAELDSDVAVLLSHRNRVIACASRACRVITAGSGALLPSGVEESRSVVMHIPSLASITACCVVRDAHLCLGTADARLFFFFLRGGAPTFEFSLRGKDDSTNNITMMTNATNPNINIPTGCNSSGTNITNNNPCMNTASGFGGITTGGSGGSGGCGVSALGGDRGAVIQLIFLNEQNQNLLLAILDTGLMYVYSYVNQCVLQRLRLVRRFTCRLRRVIYIAEDASVICGDSLGCVRGFDVRGCTAADGSDFRQGFMGKFMFHGATDEITAMEAFACLGRRHLLVASLDHHVRLFQLDDGAATWSANSMSSLPSVLAGFVYVGTLGRGRWDLAEPSTFGADPPRPATAAAALEEEEALLDGLLSGHGAPGDEEVVPCGRVAHRGRPPRSATPPVPTPAMNSPRPQPFFVTESAPRPLSRSQRSQTSLGSFAEVPALRRPNSGGARVSLLEDVPALAPRMSQVAQLPSMPQVAQMAQPRRASVRPAGMAGMAESPRTSSPDAATRVETGSPHQSDNTPRGRGGGRPTQKPSEGGELRSALVTRRKLAERMEEYKKQRAERQRERRDAPSLVTSRHVLAPVVLPRPSTVSQEAHRLECQWQHMQQQQADLVNGPSLLSKQAARPN